MAMDAYSTICFCFAALLIVGGISFSKWLDHKRDLANIFARAAAGKPIEEKDGPPAPPKKV